MSLPTRTLAVAAALCASASAQQTLLVCDSGNDRVMQYNAFDGSLINANFIVNAFGTPYGFSTPKEAIQVNNEIWVVDQVEDAIHIFDLAGAYLSSITTGLDNIRGGEFVNGTIYITNEGTGNGAPGEAVVMFDSAKNNLGSFPINGTSAFDVIDNGGEILVSDFATDAIDRYTYAGTWLGAYVIAGGGTMLNSPEQISRNAAGNVLAAGFGAPIGAYEYDPAGVEVNYIPHNAGLRGVWELGNGNIMLTSGIGVHIWDPVAMTTTDVTPDLTTSGQNVSLLSGAPPPKVYCSAKVNSLGCTPTVAGVGTPSATAGSGFSVTCAMVRNNKSGLLFYKVNGMQANVVFQCGTLCVGPSGIKRTPAQSAGGNPNPANDCSGLYSLDMNAFTVGGAGGNPDPALGTAGAVVHAQWWGRDQGFAVPCNTTLSDGLEFTQNP